MHSFISQVVNFCTTGMKSSTNAAFDIRNEMRKTPSSEKASSSASNMIFMDIVIFL